MSGTSIIDKFSMSLTNQTVKILMRQLIRSRLIWISIVCKYVSEFTRLYPRGRAHHEHWLQFLRSAMAGHLNKL